MVGWLVSEMVAISFHGDAALKLALVCIEIKQFAGPVMPSTGTFDLEMLT